MAGARLFDIARNRMLTGIRSRHPDWPAFSPSFAAKPSDKKFSGRPATQAPSPTLLGGMARGYGNAGRGKA